jgi:hypothetical protein
MRDSSWVHWAEASQGTPLAKQTRTARRRKLPVTTYLRLWGSTLMLAYITSNGCLQHTCWETGSKYVIAVLWGADDEAVRARNQNVSHPHFYTGRWHTGCIENPNAHCLGGAQQPLRARRVSSVLCSAHSFLWKYYDRWDIGISFLLEYQ